MSINTYVNTVLHTSLTHVDTSLMIDLDRHNNLNPEINKGPWTHEEDAIIIQAHNAHGNRWAEIAKKLNGRSAKSLPPLPFNASS